MQKNNVYIIVCLLACIVCSCSVNKSIPAGDALYTGASVSIKDSALSNKKEKALRNELEALTRPRPNKKILGIRFKLFMYNLAGTSKKEKSFSNWLKNKFGEAPVLLSDVNLEYNSKVLRSTLENQGFFHATVTGDTTVKDKKASATYVAQPGPQYRIHAISFPHDSSILSVTILQDSSKTLLKKGDPFDLGIIKSERERIDAYLKEKGFYYFNPEYLIVQADTTIGNHTVNLYVKPKPQVPESMKKVYTINDVFIFTNFRLNVADSDTVMKDAVFYKGYYVLDKRKLYKPKLFAQSMQFDPGDIYNRTDHNQSISRLVNLGLFKFVKNRFETASVDSPKLNTYYYLTPFPKKSIRAEINGSTKSNNLTGSSLTIGWRNRNTFKAGELFTIDATGGLEYQYSTRLKGYNTYRGGVEANLVFPRFIIPFFQINTKGGYVPKTNLLLAYDVLNKRKLYSLNSFRLGYGYSWQESAKKEHQFNPVAITYVQPLTITDLYKNMIDSNPTLQKAIDKQFILGSSYNYNYNGLLDEKPGGSFYYNGNIDLSGNIAGLVSGADIRNNKPKYIANAIFSQYIRLEGEMRYYNKLSEKKVWANRLIVGFGYPYGNSAELPFIKQFFSGGNNSLRAFRSRSVGPGTYQAPTESNILPDQSGDIKLELNTELRAKLFSIVNGAIFVDAGNVWLYNENPSKPGAKFSSNFLKELAVGTGIGLRFDVTFLVLRLDVAFPLRKPFLPDGERWVMDQIKFGDPDWRKENLVFNLAIGYPF